MRPRVTLKLATSLDGRIATATGESQWITGPQAREQGHRLRATHDAILVGIETVLADNPRLTTRLPSPFVEEGGSHTGTKAGKGSAPSTSPHNPLRIILDSQLRTPETAHVAASHSLILTTAEPRAIGQAEVIRITADTQNRPSIPATLDLLSHRGIASVLIEGGGRIAAAFIQAGMVDQIEWFRASILLGGDGRPGIAALDLANLALAPQFRRLSVRPLGDDLWETYLKA